MATEKQIKANKENAQLSTGAITEEGKAIVACNAIKHGIFAKTLVIGGGYIREDENEYKELLDNLTETLHPNNQLEHLLVEKIATDFWRLKRVIRFETASIHAFLRELVANRYSDGNFMNTVRDNSQLDKGIAEKRSYIQWNKKYLKCLREGIATFDKPEWDGGGVLVDIEDKLLLVCEELGIDIGEDDDATFDFLQDMIKKAGLTEENIREALITALENKNEKYEAEISEMERQKKSNNEADAFNAELGSLPSTDNADKIMRYESFIQKSIAQNLILLRNLQRV